MSLAVPQLHDALEATAARLPDKVAVVHDGQRVTYATIDRRANALAHALAAAGIARGDRVVVFADNGVDTIVAFWAALKADAVVSMVNPLTKADKLAYMLNDCRARALVVGDTVTAVAAAVLGGCPHLTTVLTIGRTAIDDPRASAWDDVAGEREAASPPARTNIDVDLASIVYTSGSTGEPKGVMLTHRNMITAATSVSTYLGLAEDDVILCVLPLAFDYGLYQMLMSVLRGATLVLERSFAYPAQALNLVAQERVTVFPGVPTIFAILGGLRSLDRFDLGSVRTVTNTAAALPTKHIALLQRVFPGARIFSMYGLTECKRCTYLPPEDIDRKPDSVGIAIPNTELWIVDGDGERVGPGVVGELVIRGATVMRGYWEKPEATARRLKPGPLPGEMVLHTGDLCRLDDEGYLYFVSRMDDIIKSRGEKVSPKEVENAIYSIGGVREVAVVGVPDEILGQAPKAFVVLEPDATLTESAIRRECQRLLEGFMVPRDIVIVESLPKTSSGKIKKTDLA